MVLWLTGYLVKIFPIGSGLGGRVKRLLLDQEEQGEKPDFSELVQSLLETWIDIQEGENPDILLSRFSDIRK